MASGTPLAAPSVAKIYPLDVLVPCSHLILRAVGIHKDVAVYHILSRVSVDDSADAADTQNIAALIEVALATEQVRVQLTGVQGVFTAEGGLVNLDSTMEIFCPNNYGAFGSINKTRLMDYTIPSTMELLEWRIPKHFLVPNTQISVMLRGIRDHDCHQQVATITSSSKNLCLHFVTPELSGTKRFLAAMGMLKIYYALYYLHLELCIPIGILNRMDPITPFPPTVNILGPLAKVVIRPAGASGTDKFYELMDADTLKIVLVVEASFLRHEVLFRDICGVIQFQSTATLRPHTDNLEDEVFTHDGVQLGRVKLDSLGQQYFEMHNPVPVMADMWKDSGDTSQLIQVMATDDSGTQLAELRSGNRRGGEFFSGTILPNLGNKHKALILVAFIRKIAYAGLVKLVPVPCLQQYPFRQIKC